MQQKQFANRIKKIKQKQKKENTRKKTQFLHNVDKAPGNILKVKDEMFLECREYLSL